jgi:hypothetical protein
METKPLVVDMEQLRSRMALLAFFRELGEAVEDAELVSMNFV